MSVRVAGTTSPLRQGRRVRSDGVVRLGCAGRRGIHTAFLRDLGRGGMFVRVVDPEPAGRQLEFALTLPGQRRALRGVAQVVWVRDGYDAPGQPPGMALRFVALEPAAHDALSRWLPGGEEPDAALLPPPPGVLVRRVAAAAEDEGLALPQLVDASARPEAVEAVATPQPMEEPQAVPPEAQTTAHPHEGSMPPALRPGTEVPAVPHAHSGASAWSRAAASIAGVAGLTALALVGAARWNGAPTWHELPSAPAATAPREVAARPVLASAAVAQAPSPSAVTGAGAPPPPAAAPIARPASAATVLPSSAAVPTTPARRMSALTWESGAAGTRLVVRFDGTLDEGRVSVSRIGGDTPRAVVRVRGIAAAPLAGWEPATAELRRVRPGHHDGDDGGDLHLVLDLEGAGVTIARSVAGDELRLDLAAPPAAAR